MENKQEEKLKNESSFSSKKRNQLIIYIGIMILANFILSNFVNSGGARHIDGQSATEEEFKHATISTLLFGITIFGFIIGSIISFIPYRNLKYKNKYLLFSLASILCIHIICFILGIRNLFLW